MIRTVAQAMVLLLVVFTLPAMSSGRYDTLRTAIDRIVEHAPGKVGVAVVNLDGNDTLTFYGNDRFPMQSVFKFPLALAILHDVDTGALSLDQRIHIAKTDLLPRTWSPLREKYPEGDVDIPLHELLTWTVAQSDNNGCDILFRLAGGPQVVERYIHGLGVAGIAIATNEQTMHESPDAQYRNWCTPSAMAQLLTKFYRKELLAGETQEFLWQTMVNTVTGPKEIKGLLPPEAVVAHKTGSSGTDQQGRTAASNDAAIITMPDGTHVVLVVFITDAAAEESVCEDTIARLSRAVWDAHPHR